MVLSQDKPAMRDASPFKRQGRCGRAPLEFFDGAR
jgi:hypothetical protein